MPAQIIRKARNGQVGRASLLIQTLALQMEQGRRQEMHELKMQGELLGQSKMQISMGIAEVEFVKKTQLLRELFTTKDIREAKQKAEVFKLQAGTAKTLSETKRAEALHPFRFDEAMLDVRKGLLDIEKTEREMSVDERRNLEKTYEWIQEQREKRIEVDSGLLEMYMQASPSQRGLIRSTLSITAMGDDIIGGDISLVRKIQLWDKVEAAGGLLDPTALERKLKEAKFKSLSLENREAHIRTQGLRAVALALSPEELAEALRGGLLETILPYHADRIKELFSTKKVEFGKEEFVYTEEERKLFFSLAGKILKGQERAGAVYDISGKGTKPSAASIWRENLK